MFRITLGIALIAGFAFPASASFKMIEVGSFAERCPIIVRGTIVAIAEGKAGEERSDDFAVIEIAEVLKDELKGVPLKVGGKFTVRMVSTHNRVKWSTDLNYPIKTEAIWLIFLDAKGEFRIDVHPVQMQNPKAKLKLPPATKNKAGEIVGATTQEDWIKRAIDDAKREAEERARQIAERREIREIAAELAKAERIDAASMGRYLKSSVDLRRGVVQLSDGEQPLKVDRLIEIIAFILSHDGDDNVRTHAATRLGQADLKTVPRAGDLLVHALADRSDSVRLFACQALHQHGDPKRAVDVRALLKDEKKDVRLMAVTTLGRLGDAGSVPGILKVYEAEKADAELAYTFAESLARLGEKKVSLVAVRRAFVSDNWNVRFFAAEALALIDAKEAIPVAMECCALEVARIVVGQEHTGFGERIYAKLVAVLAKRTGEEFGSDPIAWAEWWGKARAVYAAPALTIDTEAAQKAFAEYRKAEKK